MTTTVSGTAAIKGKNKRSLPLEGPVPIDTVEPTLQEADADASDFQPYTPELFGRHVCPTCPAGVTVVAAAGKNNGNHAVYCCPAAKIKTVTKTVKSITKLKTKTVTSTKTPLTIRGRLYTDVNGNNQWDPATDIPFANVPVLLLALPARKRAAAGTTIVSNVTDPQGDFTFVVQDASVVPSGATLGIVTQADPDTVLNRFQPGPSGQYEEQNSPVRPSTTTMTTTTTGAAQITTIKKDASSTVSRSVSATTSPSASATQTKTTTSSTASATPTLTVSTITSPYLMLSPVDGTTYLHSVTSDSAGNIFLSGTLGSWAVIADVNLTNTDPFSAENYTQDGFLVKLSPDLRTVLWTVVIGDEVGHSERSTNAGIQIDAQGNSYASFSCPSVPTNVTVNGVLQPHLLNCIFMFMKFDSQGNLTWAKGVGDSTTTASPVGYSIIGCSLSISTLFCGGSMGVGSIIDGSFNLTAASGAYSQGVYFGLSTTNGTLVHADMIKADDVTQAYSYVNDIIALEDGSIFLGGSFSGNVTFFGIQATSIGGGGLGPGDSFVVKVKADTTAEWLQFCGDPTLQRGSAVNQMDHDPSSGALVILGGTTVNLTCSGGFTLDVDPAWVAGFYSSGVYLLKVNGTSGKPLSAKTFGGFADLTIFGQSLALKNDNTLLWTGGTTRTNVATYPPGNNISVPFSMQEGASTATFVVKQDLSTLEVLDVQTFSYNDSVTMEPNGLTLLPNGDMVIGAGITSGPITSDKPLFVDSKPWQVNGSDYNLKQVHSFFVAKLGPQLDVVE